MGADVDLDLDALDCEERTLPELFDGVRRGDPEANAELSRGLAMIERQFKRHDRDLRRRWREGSLRHRRSRGLLVARTRTARRRRPRERRATRRVAGARSRRGPPRESDDDPSDDLDGEFPRRELPEQLALALKRRRLGP